MILGGILKGLGHDWEKKTVTCGLQITQHDRAPKGVLGFQMKVDLAYSGVRQQMA